MVRVQSFADAHFGPSGLHVISVSDFCPFRSGDHCHKIFQLGCALL
jgi:hypothetical protein